MHYLRQRVPADLGILYAVNLPEDVAGGRDDAPGEAVPQLSGLNLQQRGHGIHQVALLHIRPILVLLKTT